MKWTLIRPPSVRADIERIADFLAENAGLDAALKKIDEIEEDLERIRLAPLRGSLREAGPKGLRVLPVGGRGVACFVADEPNRTVELLLITYAGEDWTSLLDERS